MAVYYNEFDPDAAQWLRNLIAAKLIPDGEVDARSIVDVAAEDLRGFHQHHWFAGIAGWAHALQLADWPADRPVWTGSCPCQPFSVAGKGEGKADARHLWPAWFRLIQQCRPATVFGEQVDAAIRHGWLDDVFADLEGMGYACGAANLPAACVGAPHIRQRVWFVVNTIGTGLEGYAGHGCNEYGQGRFNPEPGRSVGAGSGTSWLGYADGIPAWWKRSEVCGAEAGESWRRCRDDVSASGAIGEFWRDVEWLECRDGKRRPIEPGIAPLAPRLPETVVKLRAYGNAIVPQVAAEFIKAFMEAEHVFNLV